MLGLEKQGVTAYRLCNAEGDGLSGLILDRYDNVVVAELHSVGSYRRLAAVRDIITREFPGATLYAQASPGIEEKEGFVLNETPPPPAAWKKTASGTPSISGSRTRRAFSSTSVKTVLSSGPTQPGGGSSTPAVSPAVSP